MKSVSNLASYLPAIALAGFCAAASAPAALANNISLSTPDGGMKLTGRLISFDGRTYQLETMIGPVEIDASSVTCEGEACPKLEDLKAEFSIASSSDLGADIVSSLVEEYGFANNYLSEQTIGDSADGASMVQLYSDAGDNMASITVTSADGSYGFEMLASGMTEIVVSSRPVADNEMEWFEAAGLPSPKNPSQERVFALDALAPMVSPANRIRSVSIDELAQIAAGQIRNWSELGGEDRPIRMILPMDGSSSLDIFVDLVMAPSRLTISDEIERAKGDETVANLVSSDPLAIGIASISAQRNAAIVPIRRICGPLTRPTEFSIKAEEYPLTLRLYMYTSGAPIDARTTDLINFATSDAAQDAIQFSGFVDQTIYPSPIDSQGVRLASAVASTTNPTELIMLREMSIDLVAAERLSTAFRFTSGSSGLDTKALGDIGRMADFLSEPNNQDYEILVLGFTDSIGRADLNTRLGLQRAEQVRDALQAAAGNRISPDRFTVRSYGSLAPVGCNETQEGRSINRRVEVWIRDRTIL